MIPQSHRFNSEAIYRPGGVHPALVTLNDLVSQTVLIQAAGTGFHCEFPNLFTHYRIQVASDTLVKKWQAHHLSFWQNQLNFAIWCATTGCGVSASDHLLVGEPLAQALFRFHAYYQTRRILTELRCPLPTDDSWDAYDNAYDQASYQRICAEFGVSPHTDWRQMKSANNGLGLVYFYVTHTGYKPVYGVGDPKHYDPKRMSFSHNTGHGHVHVDFIKQGHEADNAAATFILEKSEGFTRAGVERLNESIRTYVWAILGAQSQTRTSILGTGTAFDAQKQYLADVEDAINSAVDLPGSIARFQNVLQYASSKVDFVCGLGLYMAPSDMDLRVGQISGYNNLIVIASEKHTLGLNLAANAEPVPEPTGTGEKGIVTPQEQAQQAPTQVGPAVQPADKADGQLHADEKTALVVGAVGVGLAVLWLTT